MWPTIITGTIAVLALAKLIHCIRRSFVHDGNTEGFGIFIYAPVVLVLAPLAIVFGVIWALS